MTTELATCKVTRVLTDVRVIIEPGGYARFHNIDDKGRAMDRWAKEVEAHFRDHRSMDVNSVEVERVYMDQCSRCHREYEEFAFEQQDDTPAYTGCAYCGAKKE